jgi:type IV pilus assembly protein PilN
VIVRIFDEIVRTLPDGVYYRGIQSSGSTITIQGTAESNNRVSSLMRKLEASEWFANPTLKGVKANPAFGEQGNDFDLTVTVTMPGVVAEEGQGG